MSVTDSIIITAILSGICGLVILLDWLFVGRQVIRNTSAGRLYPKFMGMRIGGSGVTERSIRRMAASSALIVLLLCTTAAIFGYGWWFGLVTFYGVSMLFLYLDMSREVELCTHDRCCADSLSSRIFTLRLSPVGTWMDALMGFLVSP
ncbi:MAG: hypothetical protein QHH26_08450 [Armatimonadota bacterium]|nr:hypothetical protein [Armatimonadota bacterium]